MSRTGDLVAVQRVRFPRVSGDEPEPPLSRVPDPLFSPRERG